MHTNDNVIATAHKYRRPSVSQISVSSRQIIWETTFQLEFLFKYAFIRVFQ